MSLTFSPPTGLLFLFLRLQYNRRGNLDLNVKFGAFPVVHACILCLRVNRNNFENLLLRIIRFWFAGSIGRTISTDKVYIFRIHFHLVEVNLLVTPSHPLLSGLQLLRVISMFICRLESRKKRPFGPRLSVTFELKILDKIYYHPLSCTKLIVFPFPCYSLVPKKLSHTSLMLWCSMTNLGQIMALK